MGHIEKKTGFFNSFDDAPIYYEVRGEGQPIVFAYGLLCLINHFHPQLQYFSKNYQTIVFDYRGHHKSTSPKNKDSLTVESLAKDLQLLLDHLNIEKAHFVGHSFGAQVLLKSYNLFSDRFLSISFLNGFARLPAENMFGSRFVPAAVKLLRETHKTAPSLSSALWKIAINNPISIGISFLAGGFNLQLTKIKDVEIYIKGVSSIDLDVFTALFNEMVTLDFRPLLKNIQIPVLIISGDKDTLTPEKYQQELHREVFKSELLLVPYGSHCTQLDFPELINLRIEKFFHDQRKKDKTQV